MGCQSAWALLFPMHAAHISWWFLLCSDKNGAVWQQSSTSYCETAQSKAVFQTLSVGEWRWQRGHLGWPQEQGRQGLLSASGGSYCPGEHTMLLPLVEAKPLVRQKSPSQQPRRHNEGSSLRFRPWDWKGTAPGFQDRGCASGFHWIKNGSMLLLDAEARASGRLHKPSLSHPWAYQRLRKQMLMEKHLPS